MAKEINKVGNDIYGVKSNWKLEQKLGDSAETGFRHNDRYHKYFHGYTEVRVEKPNGKYAIQRIYTEDWYAQDCSDNRWIANKVLVLLLAVFSFVFYIITMSLPGLEGNVSRYVAIPGFSSILLLIFLVASSIGYVFTKRKMTWWEQHSSRSRIDKLSITCGVLLSLTALLIVVNIFTGVEQPVSELLLALRVALCAAADFVIYFLENKTTYKTIKNDAVLPEGEAHLIL